MPIRENLAVVSGTAGQAGAAAHKTELDEHDKVDFGAALGAMLTIAPPPAARVKADPAALSRTSSNPTSAANGGHLSSDIQLAVAVANHNQSGSEPEAGFGSRTAPEPGAAPLSPSTLAADHLAAPPAIAGGRLAMQLASLAQPGTSLEGTKRATVIMQGGPTRDAGARGASLATSYPESRPPDSPRAQPDAVSGNAVGKAATHAKQNPAKSQDSGRFAKGAATNDFGGRLVEGHGPIQDVAKAASRPASTELASAVAAPASRVTGAAIAAHVPVSSHSQSIANASSIAPGVDGHSESRNAPPVAVAQIHQPGQLPMGSEPARAAALKIDLAEGASARANVRERAGAVEVRIVTSDSAVAQHLVDQVGSLRHALDATGLRLHNADVSYRGEGGAGRQGGEQDQAPHHDRTGTEKVFTGYEAEK
jgi:hypothetical protein